MTHLKEKHVSHPTRFEMWRYYWKRNLAVTPLLLVRIPIMAVGISLIWIGTQICKLGELIPGWQA